MAKPAILLLPVLASLLVAGCGGSDDDGPSRPAPGLYAGTAAVTFPRYPTAKNYVSLAEVAPDGSVDVFSVREPLEEDDYNTFTYFLSAGTSERREAQITIGQFVSSTGVGSARRGSDARFSFVADGVGFDFQAEARSFPNVGAGCELREGTYRGEVYLIDQDGGVGGFGTVKGSIAGRRLTSDLRIATRRTGIFSGNLNADLGTDGSTVAALMIGDAISTSGVTWSGDGTTLRFRYVDVRGETKALFELRRR